MPTIHTTNDPQRAIYIDLQRPHDYFTNNDIVCGTVCVHPTTRPNGIAVVFKGRCKNHAHNTLTLFLTRKLLFDSTTNEESYAILDRGLTSSGKVELPFEFHFPTEVEMAPGGMYQPRPGFEHEEGHPLPTSMVHGDNKIEYLLEVAVYKKVDWSPDEIITLALPFRPIAAAVTSNALVQSPQYPDLCIRGHHLDPRNDSKPSTLTRLKWATLSKYQHAVPEARFRIIARCPFLLTAGSTVPIAFAFYDLGHSPELLEPPRVYVRRIRVKLTSLLAVRVPYVGPTGEREVVEDIEKEILDQIFTTTNTVMRHGLQLAEIGDFNLPLTVLPSFKTYGLRLVYRIKVVVEGHCGQETFKVTALRDFCKIVCDVGRRESGRVVSAAPGTSRLTPAGPAPAIPIPEEQPPAYEQAPSYDDALPSDSCRSQGSPIP